MPDQPNPLSSMIEHARGCLAQAARLRRELPDAATGQRWETFYQGLDDMAVNHDRIGAILTDLLTATDAALIFAKVVEAGQAIETKYLVGFGGDSRPTPLGPSRRAIFHYSPNGAFPLCELKWAAGTLVNRTDMVTCESCLMVLDEQARETKFKVRDRVRFTGSPGVWIITEILTAGRLEVVAEGTAAPFRSFPHKIARHMTTGNGAPDSLEESRQRWAALDRNLLSARPGWKIPLAMSTDPPPELQLRDRVFIEDEPGQWIIVGFETGTVLAIRAVAKQDPEGAPLRFPLYRVYRHGPTGPLHGELDPIEVSRQKWAGLDEARRLAPSDEQPVADRTIEEMTRAVALPPRAPAQRRSVIRRVTEAVRSYSQARLDVE